MVEIRLLGGFSLTVAKRETPLRLARAKSLLAYLAIESGQHHSREALAVLFWPDLDPSAAMSSLRQVIHHLRAALGEHGDGPASLLDVGRQTIRFRSGDACWIDAVELLESAAKGDLKKAADLYRGDLLADVPIGSDLFHQWLEVTRQKLRGCALDMLGRLVAQEVAARDWSSAQQCAERRVRLDPLNEAAHRDLMTIYSAQGLRHAAIAQFEQCAQMLWEELGIRPARETIDLYNRSTADPSAAPTMPLAPDYGLSALQRQKLIYYFCLADNDTDGIIRREEFWTRGEDLCRRSGHPPSSTTCRDLCEAFMAMWSGFGELLELEGCSALTLDQWLMFWGRWNIMVSTQAARREFSEVKHRKDLTLIWFEALDTDGDDRIDARQYGHWLHTWSERIDFAETFRHLDTDGDGYLSSADVLAVATEFFLSSDPEARGNFFLGDPFSTRNGIGDERKVTDLFSRASWAHRGHPRRA
jgi:DNA-binding SARP family transcriptional activator/Ca2+-binding EF-hand superfamily protein